MRFDLKRGITLMYIVWMFQLSKVKYKQYLRFQGEVKSTGLKTRTSSCLLSNFRFLYLKFGRDLVR